MKGLSTRCLLCPALILSQVIMLASCNGMGETFDNRTQQVTYTDVYAPNATVNLDEGTHGKGVKSSQKVSEKEITQTSTPKVTTTSHSTNSSQVPLNAPTVD